MSLRRSLLPLAALALAACDYGAPSEVVNGVIVYSQPAVSADFAPLQTYFLHPQMRVRKDGVDLPDRAVPASVEAAIDAQMVALGYTKCPAPCGSNPDRPTSDVGLKLSVSQGTVDYYYSGGWCDIYYGWYGCYYPPVYAGSYAFGTSLLNMVDTRGSPAVGAPFPNLWLAVMYGVLTDVNNTARLVDGINRAFGQSPYLKTAP